MAGPHLLIVEARFYDALNDALIRGATRALEAAGASWEIVTVPGALEIGAAIAMAERASATGGKHFDGYVALGCVIRGETSHYDLVAGESARALQDLAVQQVLAIGNGIITVEDEDQAWARADADRKDKGGDAARAALTMIDLKQRFGTT